MRNKKYRLWKAVILLIIIAIAELVIPIFLTETWKKIIFIVIGTLLIAFVPIVILQFFQVKSDRIIARGTNSLNKAYNRSIKKCVFMLDTLTDIYVEADKIIWLCLKDGTNVSISLGGFFKKREIVGLIYEVRAQIKGYTQNLQ